MTAVAVFDCMTFVQWVIRSAGPSGCCIRLVEIERVESWMSVPTYEEVVDVLNRPEFRQKQPQISDTEILDRQRILQNCFHFARQVNPRIRFSRDPNDEPYLNLCLTIRADFLVTLDRDLLDLNSGNHPDLAEVRCYLPKLRIVTPQEFLAIIDQEYPPHD